LHWFEKRGFQYKILIAGNHDFYFEQKSAVKIKAMLPDSLSYLNDQEIVINELKIWDSPVMFWFFDRAFNRQHGSEIRKYRKLIPRDVDIFVTHDPIFQLLDSITRDEHVGCKDLLEVVSELQPKAHVCGHIYEAYGMMTKAGTKFINASVLDETIFYGKFSD
jgi:predicted phosphohydrolase